MPHDHSQLKVQTGIEFLTYNYFRKLQLACHFCDKAVSGVLVTFCDTAQKIYLNLQIMTKTFAKQKFDVRYISPTFFEGFASNFLGPSDTFLCGFYVNLFHTLS